MGGESSNQQRQEVCHQVEKPTGDGEQDWTRGDRCVVRRWNGQYADAVIEELGSSGKIVGFLSTSVQLVCLVMCSENKCERPRNETRQLLRSRLDCGEQEGHAF